MTKLHVAADTSKFVPSWSPPCKSGKFSRKWLLLVFTKLAVLQIVVWNVYYELNPFWNVGDNAELICFNISRECYAKTCFWHLLTKETDDVHKALCFALSKKAMTAVFRSTDAYSAIHKKHIGISWNLLKLTMPLLPA